VLLPCINSSRSDTDSDKFVQIFIFCGRNCANVMACILENASVKFCHKNAPHSERIKEKARKKNEQTNTSRNRGTNKCNAMFRMLCPLS
jgi:hypothetical protein